MPEMRLWRGREKSLPAPLSLMFAQPEIIGIVENVRSLYNVGAIFRTADGAGLSKLILCGITGCPPRDEIRKAALGAEETVPWSYAATASEAIRELKQSGYWILALEKSPASTCLYELDVHFPLALIVGHEFHGITPETLHQADAVAHLPMFGQKTSLNVSVAFGVAVYELRRRAQRELA